MKLFETKMNNPLDNEEKPVRLGARKDGSRKCRPLRFSVNNLQTKGKFI